MYQSLERLPTPPPPPPLYQPYYIARSVFFVLTLFFFSFFLFASLSLLIDLAEDGDEAWANTNNVPEFSLFLLRVIPVQVQLALDCFYPVYTYSGHMMGPTVFALPGENFVLRVENMLGKENESAPLLVNTYHSPNTTSIHFHGLHVSSMLVDNVFATILPGERRDISVPLRFDHPAGTFLIHPHYAGSAALQMGFAMASPLIVLDRDARWRKIHSLVVMIQLAGFGTKHFYSDVHTAMQLNHGPAITDNMSCLVNKSPLVMVNGYVAGALKSLCNGDLRRWRVINAAIEGALILHWNATSPLCRLYLVAKDGIYVERKQAVRADVVLPPGGRVDFIVHGSECGGSELMSFPVSKQDWLGTDTKRIPFAILVSCEIFSSKAGNHLIPPLPRLPSYMTDVDDLAAVTHQHRVLEWTQDPSYGINHIQFSDAHPQFSVRLGHVEEWVIRNPMQESHPFHMHTNHFQWIGSSVNPHLRKQWRDTVFVPAGGNITIRWMPKHFLGPTLLHCHILTHEDQGMMWRFDVVA